MTENWRIQVSPKLADGTLINLRAENPREAEEILEWAINNATTIQKTVAAFNGVSNVAGAFPGAGTQVVQQAPQEAAQGPWSQQGTQQSPPPAFVPQQPAQAAPQGAAQHCVHGPMQLRSSRPGAARTWSAWMCPTPKDTPGQCSPLDAKTLKPWG